MHPTIFTPLQEDCYDFYIVILKIFSQILRHIIRLFRILLQIFMGAKIYSQDAKIYCQDEVIFSPQCKKHLLQPRKKGLRTTFKQILACIFLSVRPKSLVTLHYEIPCRRSIGLRQEGISRNRKKNRYLIDYCTGILFCRLASCLPL